MRSEYSRTNFLGISFVPRNRSNVSASCSCRNTMLSVFKWRRQFIGKTENHPAFRRRQSLLADLAKSPRVDCRDLGSGSPDLLAHNHIQFLAQRERRGGELR